MGRPKKVVVKAEDVAKVEEVNTPDSGAVIADVVVMKKASKKFNRNVFYNSKEYSTGTVWNGEIPKEIAEYLS